MSTSATDRSDRADRRLDLLAELARRRAVAHRHAGWRQLPAARAASPGVAPSPHPPQRARRRVGTLRA